MKTNTGECMPLRDHVCLTCLLDKTGVSVTLEFSYTTGGNTRPRVSFSIAYKCTTGEVRDQVEDARTITDRQTAVLDKIKRVHVFFENLEGICGAIKEVRPPAPLTHPSTLTNRADTSLYRRRL